MIDILIKIYKGDRNKEQKMIENEKWSNSIDKVRKWIYIYIYIYSIFAWQRKYSEGTESERTDSERKDSDKVIKIPSY